MRLTYHFSSILAQRVISTFSNSNKTLIAFANFATLSKRIQDDDDDDGDADDGDDIDYHLGRLIYCVSDTTVKVSGVNE